MIKTTTSGQRGFTLIEVLVALAIFAVSITALSATFHSNIRNATILKEKTLASWLAENELVDIRAKALGTDNYPAVTTRTDQKEYAGRNWRVVTTVSKAPGPFKLLRIDIKVSDAAEEKSGVSGKITGFLAEKS